MTPGPRAGGSAPSDLPCGIDDRLAEFRQEAPVVEVPPRVEIAPMVGGNRAPSTPQHPATSEDKAQKVPPRVEVLRRAGASKDAVADRWEREGEEDNGDPQPGDAHGVGVESAAACGVERIKEHRLVLHLLVAVPPEQPGDARVDAVEQFGPREEHVADLAEEVLARHGDRA